MRGKTKEGIADDGLAFSKAKQLRDGLSFARDSARAMINASLRRDKLKKLARQTEGLTYGVERSNNYVSMKGWIEFPGRRYYMRSSWERNICRYLVWLMDNGEIKNFGYETKRFDFPIKRGNNSYLPDFEVINKVGKLEWWEVKGYCAQKDRTKMKRFLKYFPNEKLIVIDADQYKAIARECKKLIKGWE